MIQISVVIITFNEEKNIGRCLNSVKEIADEIIVVDSSSTDNTVAIAKQNNAKVIVRAFTGYADQKNFGTQQAAHNWILSLDADEELTPDLRQSIEEIKKGPQYNVYDVPRLTNYCGKWIKHCGWYPDKQTRLYDSTKGKWKEMKVHEYWRQNNEAEKKGVLKGDLLHYSFTSISDHLKKIEKYTELAAMAAVENGKDASLLKIWFSPKWHFFTEYIIKLGFLDGYYGYIICNLSAYSALIKYSKIRQYNQQKKVVAH